MGGRLAEPRTEFENENVMSIVDSEASYWIGKLVKCFVIYLNSLSIIDMIKVF